MISFQVQRHQNTIQYNCSESICQEKKVTQNYSQIASIKTMVTNHKKIELNGKTFFETITGTSPNNFNYPLKDQIFFINIKQGNNVAITGDQVVEIPEGNLAFANSGNIIFKSVLNQKSRNSSSYDYSH